MPWCPQCGAEYRQGYTECAKCGVALQARRPDLPQPKRRIAVPRFLQRPWRDMQRAWGYGVEAARVLRRHPVLLVVPLIIGSMDVAERAIGADVAVRAMPATERRALEELLTASEGRRSHWRERVAGAAAYSFGLRTALVTFASPLPKLTLGGSVAALQAQLDARHPTGTPRGFITAHEVSAVAIALILQLLVAIPFASALYGGLYGTADAAISAGVPSLARFWASMPAVFFRFYAFASLLLVAWLAAWTAADLVVLASRSEAFHLWLLAERGWGILVWVVVGLIGLTRVAVATDDLRFVAALRASVRTVIRSWGVAIVLVVGLLIADAITIVALSLLPAHVGLAEAMGGGVSPTRIGRGIFDAVFGTWFLLVSFLWYRDASARLALRSFDTSPAPPLESA